MHQLVLSKYVIQPVQSVDKLTNLYLVAADSTERNVIKSNDEDNYIYRVSVNKVDPELMKFRGNSGFFYEYDCSDIKELREFCNDTRCQTLALFGDEKIIMPLVESGIKGVDRVARIGHTMDFDLIWDGYNLVERFTRTISR